MPSVPRDTHPGQYPFETKIFVKLLREQGLSVGYEDPERQDRQYFTHDAHDLWLPIMDIAANLGLNVAGGLLATGLIGGIRHLVSGHESRPLLHVEIRVHDSEGFRELKIDGSPDDVFDAIERL